MAHVFNSARQERPVKNLGWLLDHSAEVGSIAVYQNGLDGNEASLVATGMHAGRGWVFYSPFASRDLAIRFASRRAFAHARPVLESNMHISLRELRGRMGAARS